MSNVEELSEETTEETTKEVSKVELDEQVLKDLEKSLDHLDESIEKNRNDLLLDSSKIDNLIQIIEEKELKELEKDEENSLKKEKELELIEYLLSKDELTEEEEKELEKLLEKENKIIDLEHSYLEFKVENQASEIEYLEGIYNNSILISEQLNEIIEHNEKPSTTDQIMNLYGFIFIPIIVITFILWKILKPFIR